MTELSAGDAAGAAAHGSSSKPIADAIAADRHERVFPSHDIITPEAP
jgi:hypothetical protein